ncbi:MAG TPA: hypothetical protein VKE69_11160, partial [Planctomycetota bacterium]|nr:hypothetical protein [Planctomycetota bacterium]
EAGPDRALAVSRRLCERSRADDADVRVVSRRTSRLGFVANAATEAIQGESVTVAVRVRIGERLGTARVEGELADAADRALALALEAAPSGDLAGAASFPEPGRVAPKSAFASDTRDHPLAAKASALASIVARCRASGLGASGWFETSAWTVTHVSSRGIAVQQPLSRARISVAAAGPGGIGREDGVHADVARLDPTAIAEAAVREASAERAPTRASSGGVALLEPAAFAELLVLAFVDGLLRPGAPVAQSLEVHDDVHHPLEIGEPFDDAGAPRRRVVLASGGASREARPARHVVVDAGSASREDLLRDLGSGVVVARLQDVSHVDGAIVASVSSALRLESKLGALLAGVRSVGSDVRLVETESGALVVAPAVTIDGASFVEPAA